MVPRSLVERYENEAGRKETRREVRAQEYFIGGRARVDPGDALCLFRACPRKILILPQDAHAACSVSALIVNAYVLSTLDSSFG